MGFVCSSFFLTVRLLPGPTDTQPIRRVVIQMFMRISNTTSVYWEHTSKTCIWTLFPLQISICDVKCYNSPIGITTVHSDSVQKLKKITTWIILKPNQWNKNFKKKKDKKKKQKQKKNDCNYIIHLRWCIRIGHQWCFLWAHWGFRVLQHQTPSSNDPVGIDLTLTPIPAVKLCIFHTRQMTAVKLQWKKKLL